MTSITRDIQTLFDSGSAVGLSDRQLLDRFADRRDPAAEAAFEALVRRHGPMVLRVCRSVLPDTNDANDAFQATFLVLVRRSESLRRLDAIGGWLHGVASRLAARARVDAARRRTVEARAALRVVEAIGPEDGENREREESRRIVQEEVGHLPERYRAVVVLCHWEGLTHEEAAARLGCPLGTVRSRIARARDLLRRRLERRGLGPAMIGLEAARGPSRLDPALVHSTVKVAMGYLAGGGKTVLIPAAVASLVQRTLWRLTMIKIGGISAAVVLVGLAGYGFGVAPGRGARATPTAPGDQKSSKAQAKPTSQGRVQSNVAGVVKILKIIPDGTVVKKGQVIVELDSSILRDQLVNQMITSKAAEANYRKAKLAREAADHELTAYVSDLFPREEREAKGEVEVAEKDLAIVETVKEVFPPGGDVGELGRKRQELELARAKLALEKARNRLHILTTYTRDKRASELNWEVKNRHSDELAKQATWELEKSKESKLKDEILACTIFAPNDGTVVLSEAMMEGSIVREHDVILRVVPPPDSDAPSK